MQINVEDRLGINTLPLDLPVEVRQKPQMPVQDTIETIGESTPSTLRVWFGKFLPVKNKTIEQAPKKSKKEIVPDFHRPQIEPPPADSADTRTVMEEMKKIVRVGEAKLERMIVKVNQQQGEIGELDGEDAARRLLDKQEEIKRMCSEIEELQSQIEKQRKSSKVFGWCSKGAAIVGTLLGIAAAAVAIIGTGGTAAIAILGGAAGVAAVAGGGTQIGKGIFDFLGSKNEGLTFENKENQDEAHIKIKHEVDNLAQSDNMISETWKNMAEVARNLHEALMTLLRN